MLLQSRMFAENLAARRVVGAVEFAFVGFSVSLQPGCICKRLVTARPIANMLSNILVLIPDMAIQVRLANEGLVASIVCAGEGTFVVMRSEVFLEATWAIERPSAAIHSAVIFVRSEGLLLGLGRRRRWRSVGGRSIIVYCRSPVGGGLRIARGCVRLLWCRICWAC